MENYAPEAKKIWITLFDYSDDDLYDGDFSYDDTEIPRILIEYKETIQKEEQTTHRVTASAAKNNEKKEITTTTTTYTTTINRSSNVTSSNQPTISQRETTRTPYLPIEEVEIGEEPENSNECNAEYLENELRSNTQNAIADLRDEQNRRFDIDNDRVLALDFLNKAHQELLGENKQDQEETKKLAIFAEEVKKEADLRRQDIDSALEKLKNEQNEVQKQIEERQKENETHKKENTQLQTKVDEKEDLTEAGLSQESKDLREDNSNLKQEFDENTQELVNANKEKEEILESFDKKIQEYNATVNKYNNLLLIAEQARKLNQDHLYEVQHLVDKVDEQNDHYDQRAQITDIELDALKDTLEALRKDLSVNDKIYSEHISEVSGIISEQNREISELNSQYSRILADNRRLETELEKYKIDQKAHEKEMDAFNSMDYENKIMKLVDDLKNAEETRKSTQDKLENAQEQYSTKLKIFSGAAQDRKREKDNTIARVDNEIQKLKGLQEEINGYQDAIDKLNNRRVSSSNKDTIGAFLEQEKEALHLKIRWASEEKDNCAKDIAEAARLAKEKENELEEQRQTIEKLKEEIYG